MNLWSRSAYSYFPDSLWQLSRREGSGPLGCGMELEQAFPPRVSPEAWSTESRELMAIQVQLGKGSRGIQFLALIYLPLCWHIHAALMEQMHEAIFSFHPTNLSKLNCNYGSSRKLYLPTIIMVMGFQEHHVFLSLNGRQGISLE